MPAHHIPRDALKRNLERLHRELESAEPLDDETRELLATVADDIERTLTGEHDAEQVAERRERIEDFALRFEAQYPRVSQVLGEITDTLTKLGV